LDPQLNESRKGFKGFLISILLRNKSSKVADEIEIYWQRRQHADEQTADKLTADKQIADKQTSRQVDSRQP
jgi:hypothetical protein